MHFRLLGSRIAAMGLALSLAIATLVSGVAKADFDLISWNMKHLGRKTQDLGRVARAISGVDLVLLQEVNLGESGAKAAATLATSARTKTGSSYCLALSEIPSDAKERYAILWNPDTINFVKTSGERIEGCPKFAATLRLGTRGADKVVREPAVSTFEEKGGRRFVVATVHLVPTAKAPEREVPHAFAAVEDEAGRRPAVLGGDFNLSSDAQALVDVKARGWTPALAGNVKTSLKRKVRGMSKAYDNVFVRGIGIIKCDIIDPFAEFPDLSAERIYNEISDHAPIRARLRVD